MWKGTGKQEGSGSGGEGTGVEGRGGGHLETGRGREGGQVIGCWAVAGGGMSFPFPLLFHPTLPYVSPSFQTSLKFPFCPCPHTTQLHPTHYHTPPRALPHPFPSQLSFPFFLIPCFFLKGGEGGGGGGRGGGCGEGSGWWDWVLGGGRRWDELPSSAPLPPHPPLRLSLLSNFTQLSLLPLPPHHPTPPHPLPHPSPCPFPPFPQPTFFSFFLDSLFLSRRG